MVLGQPFEPGFVVLGEFAADGGEEGTTVAFTAKICTISRSGRPMVATHSTIANHQAPIHPIAVLGGIVMGTAGLALLYQHCVLLYVNRKRMTNQSLRERFQGSTHETDFYAR